MNVQYILLPASPLFIAFSLFVAFVLNLMPWGQMAGVPDFVALALVFWGVHQPRKVGIGVAFLMGLLMDVHEPRCWARMRWPTRCCRTSPS
jgi:rod shape-determining protein MreD